MRRQERRSDQSEAILLAMQGWQAGLWTSIPGIIQSFNAANQTCEVQTAIQVRKLNEDGSYEWISLPLLVDVLVHFPGGGGCTFTFPVSAGDECMVILSSRCIDGWWQTGQVSPQAELRMHDLSDGIAFVGLRSSVRSLSGVSTSSAQLRTDDGAAFVEVTTGHAINITTSGNTTVTCASAVIKATSIILQNAGTALKSLLNSTLLAWLESHVHSNGNGGANTGVATTTPPATVSTTVVQAE